MKDSDRVFISFPDPGSWWMLHSECVIWWLLLKVHTHGATITIKLLNIFITTKSSLCVPLQKVPFPATSTPDSLATGKHWSTFCHSTLYFISMEPYTMYYFARNGYITIWWSIYTHVCAWCLSATCGWIFTFCPFSKVSPELGCSEPSQELIEKLVATNSQLSITKPEKTKTKTN